MSDIAAIVAIPVVGSLVLWLVLWGMGSGVRDGAPAETELPVPAKVPGVATGHHRSHEKGGAA